MSRTPLEREADPKGLVRATTNEFLSFEDWRYHFSTRDR